jgi:hypothetical protein
MQKVLTQEYIIEKICLAGNELLSRLSSATVQEQIHRAYVLNNWFTPEFTEYAIKQIAAQYLNNALLSNFASAYRFKQQEPKTVALVMAGNIPLAGFHDWLCVMLSGNKALIKCSSKDTVLFSLWLQVLQEIAPDVAARSMITDKLKDFDAVIATGSNNTNRYFEYYFGKYPHIFRNNRSSVAVIYGHESSEELKALSDDIFIYFGLGCRSVSKVFLPVAYDIDSLLPHFNDYCRLTQHSKYMNNYDYNRTLLLLNNIPHVANEFVSLIESKSVHSALSVLHYEYYADEQSLHELLMDQAKDIQAIIGSDFIPFGKAQQPALNHFSDNIDTMAFLASL